MRLRSLAVLQSYENKLVLGKIRAFEFFSGKPMPCKAHNALALGNKGASYS